MLRTLVINNVNTISMAKDVRNNCLYLRADAITRNDDGNGQIATSWFNRNAYDTSSYRRRHMQYLLLFTTTALLALGQVLFKMTAGDNPSDTWAFLFSPIFLAALVVYGIATLCWILTLRQVPLTAAYPMQALAIVIVLFIGVLVFKEKLSIVQWVGAAAILGGVITLALG
jgi:drug/metabolite transporter (DMT)-like permease